MQGLIPLLVVLCSARSGSSEGNNTVCTTTGICVTKNYNKRTFPSVPVGIDVSIHITQVTDVDDNLGTVDFIGYFDFKWIDNRVTLRKGGFSILHEEHYDKLWFPDIYFFEMKDIDMPNFKKPHMSNYIGKNLTYLFNQLELNIRHSLKN